jgi:hypothetical protein
MPAISYKRPTEGCSGHPGEVRITSHDLAKIRVEVRGFEPLASAVRRQRSTGLSYTPGTGQRNRAISAVGRRIATQLGAVTVERVAQILLHHGDRQIAPGLLDQRP